MQAYKTKSFVKSYLNYLTIRAIQRKKIFPTQMMIKYPKHLFDREEHNEIYRRH